MLWIRKNGLLALWGVFVLVMAGWAIAEPHRPITYIYWNAAQDWWASRAVYNTEGIHGFLYFPSSAFLFGPWTWLPLVIADHLWRVLWAGILAWGVFRLAREMDPEKGYQIGQIALVLAVPALSINVLRSQWELTMFAVILHAAADVMQRRYIRAGLLFAFGVAIKPLALVPGVLFSCLRFRVAPSFLFGLFGVFLLPFLHPDPDFVAGQYIAMLPKLKAAAHPGDTLWFDLVNLLRSVGIDSSYGAMTGARIVAAFLCLGLCRTSFRRFDEKTAIVISLFLAVVYLALFNPRTEEGTYANLALLLGLCGGMERRLRPLNAMRFYPFVLIALLCLHFAPGWLYRPAQFWSKQVVALASLGYIGWLFVGGRSLIKR